MTYLYELYSNVNVEIIHTIVTLYGYGWLHIRTTVVRSTYLILVEILTIVALAHFSLELLELPTTKQLVLQPTFFQGKSDSLLHFTYCTLHSGHRVACCIL